MNLFDLFKNPKTSPVPLYPPITMDRIPSASTILFYGGTKVTELAGNRLYHYPYSPPAFHAAFYIEDGLFLNVGAFRTIDYVASHFSPVRRVDIITYPQLSESIREQLRIAAIENATRPHIGLQLPDYGWRGFLHFAFRFIKPGKQVFCSEDVVQIFQGQSVTVSDKTAAETAPWDLDIFASNHPENTCRYTLFVGPKFK